jgi:lauroyl/myristoyl acyltransferase
MTDRFAVPSDLSRLVATAAAGFASRAVPLRADETLAGALCGPAMWVLSGRVARSRERMRELLDSSQSDREIEGLLRDHYRMRLESAWARARLIYGEKWTAHIALCGGEHLERARRRGKGAILWRMAFCDALIGHAACAEAGFPLTHLSHFHHGSRTQTRLALKAVAPMYCKSEERLVKERVVMGPSGSLGFLRTLASRLAANEVVSIMGENSAPQAIDVRFYGRTIGLAPGAPGLAWQTDATLLTMHAIRTGACRYEVVVSEPIAVDRQLPRREWVARAAAEFARRLAQNVSAHPESWLGWSTANHPRWGAGPRAGA